jgi:sugar phosphate isomerase/epimerase
MRRLSLDHLTITDTTPSQLADLAAATGCAGMCLFLHPMAVLPAMPDFALIGDTPERRATREAMRAGGVALDLVYPFTLAGRTVVAEFEPALETAAWLGGRLANVLCYDRDPGRRIERLAEFGELAGGYGIDLAIEFYPPSQVRSLAEALTTIDAAGGRGIGVTLDLLHVMRGDAAGASMAMLSDPRIRIAQLADGPASIAPDRIEWEAGIQRLLPGDGTFPIAPFAAALAPHVPVSVEVPQQSAIEAGVPPLERAHAAVDAARRLLETQAE